MNRRWRYIIGSLIVMLAIGIGLARYSQNLLRRPGTEQPGPGPAAAPEPAALPKATVEFGQQPLAPKMENGVPTYELELKKVMWDTGGGAWKEAYTVNGMVPGPQLRVKEGELTRFRVINHLDEPASIHWHGMILPADQDGVAHMSQDPIEPGESFVYEYKPSPAGTHWYHSHFDGAKQVSLGLYGPLIVEPKDSKHPTHSSQYDSEHIYLIGDAGLGLTMSGKGFPYNLPIKIKTGQRVLIRMVNVGVGNHPMHLHGHDYWVVAKDGNPLNPPRLENTTDIAPGETVDMKFDANNPGSWLWHCHILPHAEGPDGMFGLSAIVEYEGYGPTAKTPMGHGPVKTPNQLPGTPGKHTGGH